MTGKEAEEAAKDESAAEAVAEPIPRPETLHAELPKDGVYRILSLDGGGAKGVYPYFDRKTVTTHMGDNIELVDGGYCANNPTLYAMADAIGPLKMARDDIRVVSVGVGEYPELKPRFFSKARWIRYLLSVQLLQRTLEINTQSMDQLRAILFKDVPTIRISDAYTQPEMATDLEKLNILWQRGRESFAKQESALKQFLL